MKFRTFAQFVVATLLAAAAPAAAEAQILASDWMAPTVVRRPAAVFRPAITSPPVIANRPATAFRTETVLRPVAAPAAPVVTYRPVETASAVTTLRPVPVVTYRPATRFRPFFGLFRWMFRPALVPRTTVAYMPVADAPLTSTVLSSSAHSGSACCQTSATIPSYSTSQPAATPQPSLAPSQGADGRTFRERPVTEDDGNSVKKSEDAKGQSDQYDEPADNGGASSGAYRSSPKLLNPQDRTAQRSADVVRPAVYQRSRTLTQEEIDAQGWRAAR